MIKEINKERVDLFDGAKDKERTLRHRSHPRTRVDCLLCGDAYEIKSERVHGSGVFVCRRCQGSLVGE